jgi:protein involved in polysaccharide export with SLBB domain
MQVNRSLKAIVASLAVVAQLFTAACDGPMGGRSDAGGGVPVADTAASSVLPSTTGEYRLGTGDKVRVVVFNEPALSGEFQVDDSGTISLPLVGQIKGGGMTPRELERQLTTKLKGGYVRDPKVSIEVSNYRPFYVIGEIEKPGEYPYRNGLSILAAGAIAGGFTYRASRSKVFIKRAADSFEREFPLGPSTPVLPGDVIRVPERYF